MTRASGSEEATFEEEEISEETEGLDMSMSPPFTVTGPRDDSAYGWMSEHIVRMYQYQHTSGCSRPLGSEDTT